MRADHHILAFKMEFKPTERQKRNIDKLAFRRGFPIWDSEVQFIDEKKMVFPVHRYWNEDKTRCIFVYYIQVLPQNFPAQFICHREIMLKETEVETCIVMHERALVNTYDVDGFETMSIQMFNFDMISHHIVPSHRVVLDPLEYSGVKLENMQVIPLDNLVRYYNWKQDTVVVIGDTQLCRVDRTISADKNTV